MAAVSIGRNNLDGLPNLLYGSGTAPSNVLNPQRLTTLSRVAIIRSPAVLSGSLNNCATFSPTLGADVINSITLDLPATRFRLLSVTPKTFTLTSKRELSDTGAITESTATEIYTYVYNEMVRCFFQEIKLGERFILAFEIDCNWFMLMPRTICSTLAGALKVGELVFNMEEDTFKGGEGFTKKAGFANFDKSLRLVPISETFNFNALVA